MTFPLTRQRWEFVTPLLPAEIQRTEDEVLEDNANWLISRLYRPVVSELGYKADASVLHKSEINSVGEPINWSDLSASVEQNGDKWVVTLEEAAPNDCPTLCAYVKRWLNAWGWENIEVVTEW